MSKRIPSPAEFRDLHLDDAIHAAMTEVEYQMAQTAASDRPDMVELDTAGYILAMEENLALARAAWYKGVRPHRDAAVYLRKVVALGLRQMQEAGSPER